MKITVKKEGAKLTLVPAGRIDTLTAPEFERTINENLEGVKELVLDLAELEYMSSAGLRVLLSAQKKMKLLGSMTVINVSEMIMEIFEVTGFADILTIK